MKTARKQELKGAFKTIVAIAVLGVMIGVGVAGVTLMTDEGFFVDGNEILVEGDYTIWTHKWTFNVTTGNYYGSDLAWILDEDNEILYLGWDQYTSTYLGTDGLTHGHNSRYGIYNLADFSVIFESPVDADYLSFSPDASGNQWPIHGCCCLGDGGIGRSHKSYVLEAWEETENYNDTIAVRRKGNLLWSHNVYDDIIETGGYIWVANGEISPTGKYVLISISQNSAPYKGRSELILYEGS